MEKGASAFTSQDRLGQLTMRNLDISGTRDRLRVDTGSGLLAPGTGTTVFGLTPAGADETPQATKTLDAPKDRR
jgi:hypothetical protein